MSALAGKRIVNTRAAHQAEPLDRLLRGAGATTVAFPCIAIEPIDSPDLHDLVIGLVAQSYDWLVLASSNAAEALLAALVEFRAPLPLIGVRIATIGAITAESATPLGALFESASEPSATAQDLARLLPIEQGQRVALPQSAIAPAALEEMLVARGAEVHAVAVYQTVCGSGGEEIADSYGQIQIDAITLCSGSAARGFVERLGIPIADLASLLSNVPVACLGPSTASVAGELGLPNLLIAPQPTLDDLVALLESAFALPQTKLESPE